MSLHAESGSAPHQLFFRTAEQRTALAREMFFEEGVRPTGLVGEAVIQSWMRCTAARGKASARVAFEPVTSSRLHSTLARNRELLDAAGQDLHSMEASLAGTECRVLLTDPRGVIVHATQDPMAARQPIMQCVSRVGVNIAEGHVGTTAPGIVAKTGQACTVMGAEHFYDCLGMFQCAAAPIRDVNGRLAAVLDLSIESRPFGFDAAGVVGLYATSIENRLLQAQSREHLVLRFQAGPSLLGTPLEALAGIDAQGRVAWLNTAAARLAGLANDLPRPGVQDVFGLTLRQLLGLVGAVQPRQARLSNGLGVWVQVRLQARDGIDFQQAVAMPPAPQPAQPAADPEPHPATLGDHSRKLIETTLAACGGNIAQAARSLGVSRGTLYRRLHKKSAASPDGAGAASYQKRSKLPA